jgi:branched-subunit amino acid transport protein
MSVRIITIIIGMAIITFFIRYLPFFAFRKLQFGGFVGRFLNYLPPAIIGGLLFQSLFIRNKRLFFQGIDSTMIAAIVSTVVAVITKSLLLTVIAGVGVLAIAQLIGIS